MSGRRFFEITPEILTALLRGDRRVYRFPPDARVLSAQTRPDSTSVVVSVASEAYSQADPSHVQVPFMEKLQGGSA